MLTSIPIPILAALAGLVLVLHLFLLLGTRGAFASPIAAGPLACCGDARENSIRQITIFGGSAAFDFGLLYWLIAALTQGWLAQLALAYAWMRLLASILQTLLFLAQALRVKASEPYTLKAHLNGCGYTTVASPLWPLYWLGYISLLKRPILALRDLITRLDWLLSLPGIALLNLFTLPLKRQPVIPAIGPVASLQS